MSFISSCLACVDCQIYRYGSLTATLFSVTFTRKCRSAIPFHGCLCKTLLCGTSLHFVDGQAVLCFYSTTGFWPSYCQISTDLDKILHTLIVIRNTLVGQLRRRSARERHQAKPERLCVFFIILITHSKSYIETTDRRDFGGKPSKWRWGRVLL